MLKLTEKGKKMARDTAGYTPSEIRAVKLLSVWNPTKEIYDIQKPKLTSRKTLKEKGLIEEA